VAIGGDGTLNVANLVSKLGVKVIGVPKTIDNDITGTEFTFGFDTAVMIATEAIDRLHSTAESHQRCMIVEVMGRNAGWIATYSGIAGGADLVLVPEHPVNLEHVIESLKRRHQKSRFSIIVVAEGAQLKFEGDDAAKVVARGLDEFGRPRLGGIGQVLANAIEQQLGVETRVSVLGYVQRGGTPTPWDRVLATRFGVAAADFVHEEKWGTFTALQANRIVPEPLATVARGIKTVDDTYDVARVFFA
jgi:6-phosphofructokinase 1